MPRPRFERASPELRSAILDAAAKEFTAEDYDNVSLNRILLAAGLSKGAFYYYFDDKTDLAVTVLERALTELLDQMGELPTPNTAEEFWAEFWHMQEKNFAQMRKSPQLGTMIAKLGSAAARNAEFAERCGPRFTEARERLTGFWMRGQEIGAVRTDIPLPALLAMAEGLKMAAAKALLPADRTPTPDEFEAYSRIQVDLFRRLTSPAPAESKL